MSVGKIVDKIVAELPHTEAEISEDQVMQADRNVEEIRLSEKLNATEENAVHIFGSTDDFSETGYILPDGTKLKMTDVAHPGERYYDHRAIARAYGETVDTDKNHGFNDSFGKYLEDFVEKGSIRFDAGDPNLDIDAGIQISGNVPLTRSQENAIRDFVEWKEEREEALASDSNSFYSMFGATPLKIHIDFGADSGYFAGSRRSNRERSISYSGNNINASRIIEDIRNYYRTGEIRQPSQISEFRYSEGYDTELKLHGRELRAFESARMNSIASLKAKFDIIPAKWYLTLGDRFYVFENTSMGDYTIRYRFKIDDVDQFNSFREEFRNAIVESTEVPDSWAKNLRLQRGNGGWHNASYGQPGNAGRSYGLDGRKHYIDRTGDI